MKRFITALLLTIALATNAAAFGFESFGFGFDSGTSTTQPVFHAPLTSDLTLTRGSGTATFTRASTQYCTDPNTGTMTLKASGDPCITSAGYLSEPAATNLALQSQTFTSGSWTKLRLNASTPVVGGQLAPDGTTTASKIVEDNTASNTHILRQTVSKAASTLTYTFSVYAKKVERNLIMSITDSGGSNSVFYAFDLTGNGAVSAATTSGTLVTAPSSSITALANGYYRCTMTATIDSTVTSVLYDLRPASGTTVASGTYSGDNSSSVILWGAQLEATAFATSYIPTTTASATRAATSLRYVTSGNMSDTEGTAYAEYTSPTITVTDGMRVIGDGNGTSSAAPIRSSTSVRSSSHDGTSVVNGPAGAPSNNVTIKAATRWSGSTRATASSGTVGSNGAYDGAFALTSIGIGVGNLLTFNGYVRNVKIYSRSLSDQQLINLTR